MDLMVTDAMTMCSREIAELTGKELSNVHRDIRTMLIGLYGDEHIERVVPEHYRNRHSEFIRENASSILSAITGDASNGNHHDSRGFSWERDNRGYVVSFRLDHNHTMTLVSGYNVKLRKAIIDRWQELEQGASKPAFMIPQSLPEALRLAATLAEQKQELEQKVAQDAPAVESAKKIASVEKGVPISNFAKTIGMGPLKLFDLLRDMRILMGGNGQRRNMPFQEYLDRGYFSVRENPYEANGETRLSFTPLITGKGQQWLTTRLLERGVIRGVATH